MSSASWQEWFQGIASGRRRGVTAAFWRTGFALISLPYGIGVRLRNWLFDRGWTRSERAAVPVVSIGNLTLGGTGKTPAVEWVAKFYRERDRRVAVLSRGYGSADGRNDEALVLEENLPDVPHLQGPDRSALAQIAVEELESELLVLDDGFQHRRLARDLDIVLIDATNPWGHGWLFPRGLLREPRSSLRRASLVLLTRCDQVEEGALERIKAAIRQVVPSVPVAESIHAAEQLVGAGSKDDEALRTAELAGLNKARIVAFCGIGNPDAFRDTLMRQGAVVSAFRTFPDHHRYTRADVEDLRSWAAEQPEGTLVLTTQKDLVKIRLPDLGGRPLWALQIALRITAGQDVLDRLLKGVLSD